MRGTLLLAGLMVLAACQHGPSPVAMGPGEPSVEVVYLVNPLSADLREALEEFLREDAQGAASAEVLPAERTAERSRSEKAHGGKTPKERSVPRE